MPMRIMHVVNNLGKGGLENGLVNVIERADQRRFEHIVCTVRGLGPNADRLAARGVQLHALGSNDSTSRVQTPALRRAIRRFKPDIVHSRNWAAIEAVVAAKTAGGCAVVHSEHGYEAQASLKEPWRRTVARRVAFELADKVFAVSAQLRDLHASRTGFPAGRIAVIHNGVDSKRFCPDVERRNRIRQELGLSDAERVIGCVANLLPVKDHRTLLDSLGSVSEVHDGWRLLLVGEGPERPALQAVVDARPDWSRRVLFLGSSERVPDLLRAMDVFVLPSVAEGICNSLLEAMATGLPVVATAVGGNPEVVVDGESGFLFMAGDVAGLAGRLIELLNDPARRTELSSGAMNRVREAFSLDSMVRGYEQLYGSVRPAASVPVLSAG